MCRRTLSPYARMNYEDDRPQHTSLQLFVKNALPTRRFLFIFFSSDVLVCSRAERYPKNTSYYTNGFPEVETFYSYESLTHTIHVIIMTENQKKTPRGRRVWSKNKPNYLKDFYIVFISSSCPKLISWKEKTPCQIHWFLTQYRYSNITNYQYRSNRDVLIYHKNLIII